MLSPVLRCSHSLVGAEWMRVAEVTSCAAILYDRILERWFHQNAPYHRYFALLLAAAPKTKHWNMSRTDGRKIVAVATAGMVGVLGFAQFYLPYYADRDKIRGLSEEEDMPPAAREEMRRTMMAMQRQQAQEGAGGDATGGPPPPQQQKPRIAGSMWKNFGGGGGSGSGGN